jgi:hypothetical protein
MKPQGFFKPLKTLWRSTMGVQFLGAEPILLVPENYLQIPWYHHKTGEWTCGFPSETPRPLALNVSASRIRDFCVNPQVGIQFLSVGCVGGSEIEDVANGCEVVGRTAATTAVDILKHHRA